MRKKAVAITSALPTTPATWKSTEKLLTQVLLCVTVTGTYRFSVNGVHSKEESCYQSWPHLTENHTTQLDIQVAHCTMQEYIHQMVAHWLQLMQQVVQSERGHTQRTIRLVTVLMFHCRPPEVIPEQVGPGCLWSEVCVLDDSLLVVKTEPTV